MKELSIEEKAKRYDEASKWMEGIYSTLTHEQQGEAEAFFPIFKESEDERIRKTLIENFKWFCGDYPETTKWGKDDNLLVKDIIAWLKKQGEQAKFRDSIQVGDKVTRNKDGVLVNLSQLNRIAKKDEKKGEQKLTDFEKSVKQVMEETIECGDTRNLKADADMLLSLVQKPAWSEEDETNLRRTEYAVMKFFGGDCSLVGWLRKSLKERYNWKPSDEQLKAQKGE